MELNLCPNCDAFVSKSWTECRLCAHQLPVNLEPVDDKVVDEQLGEEAKNLAPEEPKTQVSPVVQANSTAQASELDQIEESSVDGTPTPVENDTALTAAPESGPQWRTSAPVSVPTNSSSPETSIFGEVQAISRLKDLLNSFSGLNIKDLGLRTRAAIATGMVIAVIGVVLLSQGLKHETKRSSENSTTVTTSIWITFTDPKSKFQIQLPTAPEARSLNFRNNSGSRIVSSTPDGKAVIFVSWVDQPNGTEWSRDDQILKDALESDSTEMNAEVKSQVITTQNGIRQLDAHLTDNSAHVIDTRYFVKNKTLYMMLVKSANENGSPEIFDHITRSFTPTTNS